ncbi:2252_t:CDS:2 [Entrophospora sp. SA101]|nr:2252_t:CDS:2 [Entrophospora sp. SA101]CAJ0843833.1 13106_t:CDS:2 [Entrophospora sp. SA101]
MTRIRLPAHFRIIIAIILISLILTYFSSFKHKSIVTEEQFSHTDINYDHNIKNNGIDENDQSIYNQEYPFTIVTASSSNHYCAIQSWLYYMKGILNTIPVSKRPRITVYDIGLANYQRKWIRVLLEKKYFTELRKFEFERYPAFWKVDNETRGEYAWKPGIISEVIRDYPGPTFWLDSGTYVSPGFLKQFNLILNYYDGFFSPISSGYIPTWTHQGVFDYFNDNVKKYSSRANCNGAAIAFDSNKVRHLMNNWVKCARIKQCIAPEGSNRTNHRQDQAILTYLAAREKMFCTNRVEFFGLRTHMDKVCESNIYFYEKLNNITWSPTIQDLNEIEEVKELAPDHYIYDIWNPGAKEKMLDRIRENDKEIYNHFFNLDQD